MEESPLFLKTQISPHFFFNTLNNIYSLALENSNKTSKIIQKLSSIAICNVLQVDYFRYMQICLHILLLLLIYDNNMHMVVTRFMIGLSVQYSSKLDELERSLQAVLTAPAPPPRKPIHDTEDMISRKSIETESSRQTVSTEVNII